MPSVNPRNAARIAAPFAIAGGVALFVLLVWQPYTLSLDGIERNVLYRASPLLVLGLPPLLCLPLILSLPLALRRGTAVAMLLAFGMAAAWLMHQEYSRLAPYLAQGHTWETLTPYIDRYLMAGALIGFFACAGGARLSLDGGKGIRRARRASFGDADWMSMAAAGKLLPATGGLVIGERYRVDQNSAAALPFDPRDERSWGAGGRAPLLASDADAGSGHALFFAGSGGFKTTSVVVPSALSWRGPLVCLDPSVEVAPMVADYRRYELRRVVHVLDPAARDSGFNVLDWITTSRTPEQDVATVAHWLLAESPQRLSGSSQFFQTQAHNLLTGLLAHVMFSAEFSANRTLRSLRELITEPEENLRKLLLDIHAQSDKPFVKETLGVFLNMAPQTFSGVYSTASQETQWLSFPEYADLVCGHTFKTTDIATGSIDVFINLKTDVLQTYPGIARVICGSFINAMMQADGRHAARTLFLLDEVNLLGYMRTLEIARDVGRKYGVALALIYQSIGQLKKHFGEDGKAAFFDSAALASFASVGDVEAAREISALCGEITIEVESTSRGIGLSRDNGRRTRSLSLQKRPLILPHEITQEMRADEQIVLIKGRPPLRCGRAIYFRRKDMRDKVQRNRFYRG